MGQKSIFLALLLPLAACAGSGANPVTGGDGDETTSTSGIPETLSVNLESATFDPDAQTLTITLPPFDGSPGDAEYTRQAALDTGGFQAYDLQENGSSRRYVALFKAGTYTQAGAVATNYALANQFGGTTYGRLDVYGAPTQGIATYEGSYAAVLTTANVDTGEGPNRVTGEVLLNVDFNQSLIEGEVTNRELIDNAGATVAAMDSVVLRQTAVESGTFFGDVVTAAADDLGDYGGTLGGPNAEEVAGVLVFVPDGSDASVTEYGAFVAPQTCISSPGTPCP